MNALIRKEIRLVLPAWAVAMALSAAAVCLAPMPVVPGLVFVIFGAGAILLSLRPFGQECTLGMLSSVLVQPVSRQRLWRVKTGVLAVAFASVLCVLISCYTVRIGRTSPDASMLRTKDMALVCGLIALTAYAGGLWTTLLLRQMAGAFWFTLLLPLLIVVVTTSFVDGPSHPYATAVSLLLYSVVGILWAHRQFLRAQDVQWTGGTIALPMFRWRGAPVEAQSRRRPLAALFWKEVQSHQSSFVIAGVLLTLHLLVLLMRAVPGGARPGPVAETILESWWGLWLALPLLIASSSTAEERRLGTDEAQLCLPVRRRSQAAIKVGVALLLGIFLGAIMPALIEGAGSAFASVPTGSDVGSLRPTSWTSLMMLCGIAAWITLVAFHASTLARTTLQAVGIAIFSGLVLTLIGTWAAAAGPSTRPGGLHALPLIAWLGGPILLVVLIGLAYHNFQRLRPGWTAWLLNGVAVILALLGAGATTAAVYHRVWELAAPLGPPPGPAQLTGPIRPRVLASLGMSEITLLLPDGRLWVPADYDLFNGYQYYEGGPESYALRNFRMPVPSGGMFVEGSNWVQVAGSFGGTVGLRQDGSLWKILAGTHLERIGIDSDWKTIGGGHGFFVAVKQNGSLWGWGNNHSGQLGVGPQVITGDPVQIGTDSDWVSVFASAHTCTGIKRDGSVWKWGFLVVGPDGWEQWKGGAHPRPVQWPLDGSDWLHMGSAGGTWDLILRQDGTLWASGVLPRNILNNVLSTSFTAEPVQVGTSSTWAQLDEAFRSLAAIKDGKLLLQSDMHQSSVPWIQAVWTPGKRSDWIAVTPYGSDGCLALAADGTLSLFGYPAGPPAGFSGLLAPSRKPLWSVNVLADLK